MATPEVSAKQPHPPDSIVNSVNHHADIEKADLAAESGSEIQDASAETYIDPVVEKRLLRKLDLRIIPLISGLYLLSYLDRSNIGNAKIAGLSSHFHLSSPQYQWLLTIFYIAYIIFQPLSLLWKVLPPHLWATICVLGFGLVATLQAVTQSYKGILVARFFLGMFEAGYGPGVPFLLSFFYSRRELGKRIGVQISAAPLATCFAGALAYGITSGSGHPVANWRLLFLVEGLPSVVAAGAAFFLLPDSPEKARFLTEEEKKVAGKRSVRQVGDGKAGKRTGSVEVKGIWEGVLDPKNYITALMYFSCNVSFSSLPVFLPTIIQEMGFSSINAQGLSAPPYFLAFIVVLISTYIADKTAQRGWMIAFLSSLGVIGYVMLAVSKHTAVRYIGVFLAASGVFPSITNILPWVLNNQSSDTKRGVGISILNLIGQCGPLLGTRLYPANQGPYYTTGMAVCAAFMGFNGLLAVVLRFWLKWKNGKLDSKWGELGSERNGEEVEKWSRENGGRGCGEEDEGPRFRYIL